MYWIFNPPPGWPVPPGFVPPSGWVPDPAWPPAPADWDFWVAAPSTPPPSSVVPAPPGSWADPYAGAAPPVRRGLPGWGIALIVVSVLAVLALVVAAVIGLAVAASSGFSEAIDEFDEEAARSSASVACDYAADAFIGAPSEPDPQSAGFQVRPLTIAVDEADWATDTDPSYAALYAALSNALDAAEAIAALPPDPTDWSPDERAEADAEQEILDAAADRVLLECEGVTDPWLDEGNDFTF